MEGAIAVLNIGGMNDNVQQETQRVDQDVPLATLDLLAIGARRMLRSGDLDFKANPITVVLNGPIGCRTGPNGWPSGRRGTGALPPAHLDVSPGA